MPPLIAAAIEEYGPPDDLVGVVTVATHECEGARFHSPQPLFVREVPLGPEPKAGTAWLCGTCADNLVLLRHFLVTHDGDMPWALRREFGNTVRRLAMTGWGRCNVEGAGGG